MTKILTAKELIEKEIPQLLRRKDELSQKDIEPHLCVVLVGNNQASLKYIKNKEKMCLRVGAKFTLVHLEEDINEKDFLEEIAQLNKSESIHGVIVQLPLPDQLRNLDVRNLVSPEKDVDGFGNHSSNSLYMLSGTKDFFRPCTPQGIIDLLKFYEISLEGKHCLIIGRSHIVGRPMAMLMLKENATVTIAHSRTKNLEDLTKTADVVISAIGKARFINISHCSQTKDQVFIDVGINLDSEGKLCGDIDYEAIVDNCNAITPVPGGVGPLTVLTLIKNLFQACENKL